MPTATNVAGARRPRSQRVGAQVRQILGLLETAIDENPKTRGRAWSGHLGQWGEADRILRDSYVATAREATVSLVAQAKSRFVPGDRRHPLAQEAADFQAWLWLERLPWHTILTRALSSLWVAFGVDEVTEEWSTFSRDRFPSISGDRVIVPHLVSERPRRTISAFLSRPEAGELLAEVEQETETGTVRIPAEWCLLWNYGQEGADFQGNPIGKQVWLPAYMKREFRTISAVGHERHHMPSLVATEPAAVDGRNPASPETRAEVDKHLAAYSANENNWVRLPEGWGLDTFGSDVLTDIEASIEALNAEILIRSAASYLAGGNKSVSYALGSIQSLHGHYRNACFAAHFADMFNFNPGGRLIRRYHELAFGPEVPLPRFELFALPDFDLSTYLQAWGQLVSQGAVRPDRAAEEHFRALAHLPEYLGPLEDEAPEVQEMVEEGARRAEEADRD